jgi:hypothetical protein
LIRPRRAEDQQPHYDDGRSSRAEFLFAGADDAEHNERKYRDDLFAPLRESDTERRRSSQRQSKRSISTIAGSE